MNRSVAAALLGLAVLMPVEGCKGHGLSSWFHHRRAKSKPNSDAYSDNLQAAVSKPTADMLKAGNFGEDQPIVQKFYEDRDWQLAWTRDGKPTATATALIQLFTDADKKGLRPEDYDGQQWQGHLHDLASARKDEDTVAKFDVAVTVAAVRYLSDLHLGRINPQTLNFDIDVPAKRAAFDVPTLLNDQLVDADDVGSVAASVEPQNPMYKKTEDALPHYIELAEKQAAQHAQALPEVGKPVAPGGSYPAAQALAERLALEGDGTAPANGTQYTPELAEAVKHFQARVGLNPDGKLSQGTVDALNVPMSTRVQQIGLALEHWRWLPDEYVKPRLLVNLPEFFVRAYNADGNLEFKMRVVDGEAKGNHDTPVFVRKMRYLIFRPYWNLPVSIVKKELMRHLSGGGNGYLESHGYEVINSSGQPVSGWTAEDLEHSRFLVRQKPGPKNSLGLIKFMFPNEYDIYMHSTPEMNLFNLYRRDRSHGCIRLNDAEKMANWVLEGQTEWDADKIHQAMYGEPLNESADATADASEKASSDVSSGPTSTSPAVKDNKQVNLKTPLTVVITYLTANADEDGTVHFFNDIYGYDKMLTDALSQPRPYKHDAVKINPKLTPGETL